MCPTPVAGSDCKVQKGNEKPELQSHDRRCSGKVQDVGLALQKQCPWCPWSEGLVASSFSGGARLRRSPRGKIVAAMSSLFSADDDQEEEREKYSSY
ncbi:unnamed protein product [Urochloa humidicola]